MHLVVRGVMAVKIHYLNFVVIYQWKWKIHNILDMQQYFAATSLLDNFNNMVGLFSEVYDSTFKQWMLT